MENTKLLSQILKHTNNLIISDKYKEAYSIGDFFKKKKIIIIYQSKHFLKQDKIFPLKNLKNYLDYLLILFIVQNRN